MAETAAQAPRILVYEMEIPIRWGDMDAMGHVNNTVYFRYMEQARISWFDEMQMRPDPSGEGPVIVNAACTFARQLEYPGTVLARSYVGESGRSSIMTYVDMLRTDDPGRIYAHGSAKVVWVNFPRQKSVPMPDPIRKRMQRSWPHG
jgi:acyl-CoA thioester hydrolase